MSDLVERLEPCPFCAGIADDTHAGVAPELHEDSHTNIYVWCPNCGAKGLVVVGAHGGTRQEAIAAWHRRAESPDLTRLRSEVERLREQARRNDLQARLAIRGQSLAETKLTTLTARTREVLAREWHGMETAPRDGTHILVDLGPGTPPTTVHWFADDPALGGTGNAGWYISVQQNDGPAVNPVAWQHLPIAAAIRKGDAT